MRRIRKAFRSTAKRLQQRGSALLASLMVIVGLSLLGLAFVAISETESAISVNERNHTQAVALAESGARMVVQWFQNPLQMVEISQNPSGVGLMPANNNTFKNQRDTGTYTGYYKSDLTTLLCDLPFGPQPNDQFFGPEQFADIVIDRTTAAGRTFLDNFNNKFLGPESTVDARPAGEITVIKVYAPPMVGPTLTAATPPITGSFYVGGTRYGVATIMVQAEKFDQPSTAASRRSLALAQCRIVVSQFPLPTPGGPLQSATSLATNGNFNVHWGLVSAQQTLNLNKDYTTVPWFNAYDRIQFQRGYDSSVQWAANTTYKVGDIVRPTPAAMTCPCPPGNALVRYHEYTVTANPGPSNSGATEPVWVDAPAGVTLIVNGVTYKERQPTAWPLSVGGTANPTNTPWLYYIASGGITVDDPWFQARTAQNDQNAPNGFPQPWSFFPFAGSYGATHHFQFQSFDQFPNFKQLIFPIINYDFWKSAAIAGNGQSGVKYLHWVTADQYTDGVTTQTFRNWTTAGNPGFYFFETQNNQNPQNSGPGILAPNVQLNGGSLPNYISSFVYLNASFNTTGLSGPSGKFNQPGEPYLDIGYRLVNTASATGDFSRDAAGMPIIEGAANRVWDFQDLPWSNSGGIGGGTANGVFDVYVAARTVTNPGNGATYTGYFPVPYTPGCFPGNNVDCPACNCSEPHEPYLNIKYNGNTSGITLGWFDPATAVATMRKPKKTTDGTRFGALVTCTSASSQSDCTSNAYDLDGGLVSLSPMTDGVIYSEGQFHSTGNADYYGSVLVGPGGVDAKGTPNLWYDESLSRGIRLPGFPRVMVTSVETDR